MLYIKSCSSVLYPHYSMQVTSRDQKHISWSSSVWVHWTYTSLSHYHPTVLIWLLVICLYFVQLNEQAVGHPFTVRRVLFKQWRNGRTKPGTSKVYLHLFRTGVNCKYPLSDFNSTRWVYLCFECDVPLLTRELTSAKVKGPPASTLGLPFYVLFIFHCPVYHLQWAVFLNTWRC